MSKLKIKTKERRFETAGDLYGIFFEDINRAGDGGLYPEMLRNRSLLCLENVRSKSRRICGAILL